MNELEKFPKPTTKDFSLFEIRDVNFKPHPYCITDKHISKWVINSNTIIEAEKNGASCGMYFNPSNPEEYTNHKTKKCKERCKLPYIEHKHERALLIKVRDLENIENNEGLGEYIISVKDLLIELKIDVIVPISYDFDKTIEGNSKSGD